MRIISLCPSLTELVFDLDRGRDLVACTRYCVRPADRVTSLAKIGGTKNPKIEQILELEPDLILMNREENRLEDGATLEAAGIRSRSYFPKTIPETLEMIRDLALELDRPEAGDILLAEIEKRRFRAETVARNRPPLRFAYLIWRKPWMTVNGDTYVSSLLEMAGGKNVFQLQTDRYPPIDAEELAAAAPDRVFLSSEPFPFEQKHRIELAKSTKLPEESFVLVDGRLLSWHGSSTADGIDYASSLFQADLDS
ncbi:MAG: helical backbone metal receptor [Deltaproteobacteria bacterium]|nr:helical backbone metal receptor [Deltaproteobacteria bacterium]